MRVVLRLCAWECVSFNYFLVSHWVMDEGCKVPDERLKAGVWSGIAREWMWSAYAQGETGGEKEKEKDKEKEKVEKAGQVCLAVSVLLGCSRLEDADGDYAIVFLQMRRPTNDKPPLQKIMTPVHACRRNPINRTLLMPREAPHVAAALEHVRR